MPILWKGEIGLELSEKEKRRIDLAADLFALIVAGIFLIWLFAPGLFERDTEPELLEELAYLYSLPDDENAEHLISVSSEGYSQFRLVIDPDMPIFEQNLILGAIQGALGRHWKETGQVEPATIEYVSEDGDVVREVTFPEK